MQVLEGRQACLQFRDDRFELEELQQQPFLLPFELLRRTLSSRSSLAAIVSCSASLREASSDSSAPARRSTTSLIFTATPMSALVKKLLDARRVVLEGGLQLGLFELQLAVLGDAEAELARATGSCPAPK